MSGFRKVFFNFCGSTTIFDDCLPLGPLLSILGVCAVAWCNLIWNRRPSTVHGKMSEKIVLEVRLWSCFSGSCGDVCSRDVTTTSSFTEAFNLEVFLQNVCIFSAQLLWFWVFHTFSVFFFFFLGWFLTGFCWGEEEGCIWSYSWCGLKLQQELLCPETESLVVSRSPQKKNEYSPLLQRMLRLFVKAQLFLFCSSWACEDDFLSHFEGGRFWGFDLVTRSGCRRRSLMRFSVGVSRPTVHSLSLMVLSCFMLAGVTWREKKLKGTDSALLLLFFSSAT